MSASFQIAGSEVDQTEAKMTIPDRLRILAWVYSREFRHWLRSRKPVRRWLAKRARIRFQRPALTSTALLAEFYRDRDVDAAILRSETAFQTKKGRSIDGGGSGGANYSTTQMVWPSAVGESLVHAVHLGPYKLLAPVCGPQVNISNGVSRETEPAKPVRHITVVPSPSGRCYTVQHYEL